MPTFLGKRFLSFQKKIRVWKNFTTSQFAWVTKTWSQSEMPTEFFESAVKGIYVIINTKLLKKPDNLSKQLVIL